MTTRTVPEVEPGVEPTPIFDAVVFDQSWQPADMHPPFDVQAVVAASYAMVGKPVPQPDR